MGLAALSSQPELAARVSLAVLFVPVAITRHVSSWPFVLLARAGLDRAAAAIGWWEWGTFSRAYVARARRVCGWAPVLCELYLTSVCGSNPNGNLHPDTLLRLMGHLPVGTSVRNMAYWSQVGRHGTCGLAGGPALGHSLAPSTSPASPCARAGPSPRLQGTKPHLQPQQPRRSSPIRQAIRRRGEGGLLRYDYGRDCSGGRACNRRAYGRDEPPAFNLSAITTPLALFTGTGEIRLHPAGVRPPCGGRALHGCTVVTRQQPADSRHVNVRTRRAQATATPWPRRPTWPCSRRPSRRASSRTSPCPTTLTSISKLGPTRQTWRTHWPCAWPRARPAPAQRRRGHRAAANPAAAAPAASTAWRPRRERGALCSARWAASGAVACRSSEEPAATC